MSGIPKGGWKLGRDSFSKLIVWFKDGNIRTLYSIDWKSKYGKRRMEDGLDRLKKRVQLYGPRAKAAQIYDTDSGEILHRYVEGNEWKEKI